MTRNRKDGRQIKTSAPCGNGIAQFILATQKPFWKDGVSQIREYLVWTNYAQVKMLCEPVNIDGRILGLEGPFKAGLFAATVLPGGSLEIVSSQLAGLMMINAQYACETGFLRPTPEAADLTAGLREDVERAFPNIRSLFQNVPR